MRKKSPGLFLLILVLATLATSLLGWRLFFFKPKPETPQIAPAPTPSSRFSLTPTPSPETFGGRGDSPQEILESLQQKFPLIKFLPYQGKDFWIDYISPLNLKVILKRDTPLLREEVLNWIKEGGVDPATHQIQWQTPP